MPNGVVNSRCACCGEAKFVENAEAFERRMESGEAIFCDECMALPEFLAETMIIVRSWSATVLERLAEAEAKAYTATGRAGECSTGR